MNAVQGKVAGLQQQVSALQEEVKNKQQESEAFANGKLTLLTASADLWAVGVGPLCSANRACA
jgi:hypothetical protein